MIRFAYCIFVNVKFVHIIYSILIHYDLSEGCVRGAADVMFIVDESGSIGIDNYNKVKDFLKDVVNSLNVGPDPIKDSRISLLTFSNFNNLVFNFKNYSIKASYISAISNMGYYGGGTISNIFRTKCLH